MNGALTLLAVLGCLAVGVWFRVVDLGARPMHADESVHAEKFRELWISGKYIYDPDEYHGPTIYYAALPTVMAAGRRSYAEVREQDLRLGVALVSALILLVPWMMAGSLSRSGALVASAFLAVSPSLVFYSRYFIQEALLALFTLGFLIAIARYAESRAPEWMRRAGLFAGLMVATKETAVFPFFTALLALPSLRAAARSDAPPVRGIHILGAVTTAIVVGSLLLSCFFTNPAAPLDLARSYTPWIARAHGTDLHQQPWYYYLAMLFWKPSERGPVWTEGLLALFALAGFAIVFWRRGSNEKVPAAVRFLAWNALLLTIIYSAVPYKTPWIVLTLTTLYAVMGGYTSSLMLANRRMAIRAVSVVLLAAGLAHMAYLARAAAHLYAADPRNPYVYAHTSPDLLNLIERVKAVATAQETGLNTTVQVIHTDRYYWPLPWYLRDMPRVGYWAGEIPREVVAPIVISSDEYDAELTRRLDSTHLMTGFFALRRAVHLQVWVEMEAWKRYLAKRPRPSEDVRAVP